MAKKRATKTKAKQHRNIMPPELHAEVQRHIKTLGGVKATAEAIGMAHTSVGGWRLGRGIPYRNNLAKLRKAAKEARKKNKTDTALTDTAPSKGGPKVPKDVEVLTVLQELDTIMKRLDKIEENTTYLKEEWSG